MTARTSKALCLAVGIAAAGCGPRLAPLTGAPAPAQFPRSDPRPGHWKIVFNWVLEDRDISGKGEGVARVASPDSARLDFFLSGGVGAGAALLIADTVRAPGPNMVRRLVPEPPLLWGALGRVRLPSVSDTTARLDGTTLRVDLGKPVAWRLTFRADTLVRLERVENGRVIEWVARRDTAHVSYRNETERRSLELTVTRQERVAEFDASIWSLPR